MAWRARRRPGRRSGCRSGSRFRGSRRPGELGPAYSCVRRLWIGHDGSVRLSTRRRESPGPRSAFAGFRFPAEVIVVAVRWCLRYGLSYRDVEELLAERGIEVDHVTIYRWVQRFAPLFADAARFARHSPGNRWRRRDLRQGHRRVALRIPRGRPAGAGHRRAHPLPEPVLPATITNVAICRRDRSAESFTSINMQPELHGRHFRHPQGHAAR